MRKYGGGQKLTYSQKRQADAVVAQAANAELSLLWPTADRRTRVTA